MWRVLIVDDEISVLDVLERIIPWEEYGLELAGRALGGAEALERMAAEPVHVLITDIRMPGMTGLELIREARRRHAGLRTVILTAYDEFAYVHEAIRIGVENYLLKPVNRMELSETLLKTIGNLERDQGHAQLAEGMEAFRTNLLERWTAGKIGKLELQERSPLAGVTLADAGWTVVVVKQALDARSEGAAQPSAQSTLSPRRISDLLFRGLDGIRTKIAYVSSEGHHVCLLQGDMTPHDLDAVRAALVARMDRSKRETGVGRIAAIGRWVREAEQVPLSHRSAMAALTCSPTSAENTVLCGAAEDSYRMDLDVGALERILLEPDAARARNAIGRFMDEVREMPDNTLSGEKYLVLETVCHLVRQVRPQSGDADDMPPGLRDLVRGFEGIRDQTQLHAWLLQGRETVLGIHSHRNQEQTPLIRTILSHLQEHYGEEISLKTLSQKHNINASYLGQLFKSETGELFSDWLNRCRLEKAEAMLRQPGAKVADVAARVGYNNVSHFIHLFKKRSGITPMQYRQRVE